MVHSNPTVRAASLEGQTSEVAVPTSGKKVDADLIGGTGEEWVRSVKQIRKGYEEFEKLKYLRLEYMESYEMIATDVFRTVFSDDTEIITMNVTRLLRFRGIPFHRSAILFWNHRRRSIPPIPPFLFSIRKIDSQEALFSKRFSGLGGFR